MGKYAPERAISVARSLLLDLLFHNTYFCSFARVQWWLHVGQVFNLGDTNYTCT